MFSSISKGERIKVIKNCYWPLFDLVKMNVPIGIEASAITLEIIKKCDPDWIHCLKEYIKMRKIEFIGSGYSQLIGPLVPYKLNKLNQRLGSIYYKDTFGFKPKTALVNEMAYSRGILDSYIVNDYKSIIMEWNNAKMFNPKWDDHFKYYSQVVKSINNKKINLIWADSIAFQQFQRYAHNEISLENYLSYIKKNNAKEERFFPMYSNDVEIFDYRPGRYKTEFENTYENEWSRLFKLFEVLDNYDSCSFVFPSETVNYRSPKSQNAIILETTNQPIPVKKQEKYNINRWALTGIDDININSRCFELFNNIKEENSNSHWEELCYLWSSDFRTHICSQRWKDFNKKLKNALDNSKKLLNKQKEIKVIPKIKENENTIEAHTNNFSLILNKKKGCSIKNFFINDIDSKSLFGTIAHGFYENISLGADFFSGHSVIERWGKHKITDLNQNFKLQNNHRKNITVVQNYEDYKFINTISFFEKKITFFKSINIKNKEKLIIRPFIITFNPLAWDKNSLYLRTHNGGADFERFDINDYFINQNDIYSSLISSRHAFGNTEGIIIIGDKYKFITFEVDMSISALIPSIMYQNDDNSFCFRLYFSARELDETRKNKKNNDLIKSKISIY